VPQCRSFRCAGGTGKLAISSVAAISTVDIGNVTPFPHTHTLMKILPATNIRSNNRANYLYLSDTKIIHLLKTAIRYSSGMANGY